jgi:putative transposase
MQIKGLHKNIYKLYAYARTQECLDGYRQKYEDRVRKWEKLRCEGVGPRIIQEFVGISRATYYRSKKVLDRLTKGCTPASKKPKRVNKPRWGEAEKQLVLKMRRDNPTYGKEKISLILKRDHGQTMSESTVGRILTYLKGEGLIQKSGSSLRTKRKRILACAILDIQRL